nr:MAG TPA: hypothetical protein [Caudoviricetes sp.]
MLSLYSSVPTVCCQYRLDGVYGSIRLSIPYR